MSGICFNVQKNTDCGKKEKNFRMLRKRFLLLGLVVLTFLAACTKKNVYYFYVDQEGNAIWDKVEGAVGYEAQLLDENMEVVLGFSPEADETTTYIPAGYTMRIRPVFEDDRVGDWMVGVYEGEEAGGALIKTRVQSDYKIYWEDLKIYEILENVDHSSIKTEADGSVSFTAAAPDGGVIQFVGTGITLTEEEMILHPGARLCALDAIGRIAALELCVTDSGDVNNWCYASGGYTFTTATSVDSADRLYYVPGCTILASETEAVIRCAEYQPNFISFGAEKANEDSVVVSAVKVYYDETTYHTGLRLAALDLGRYTAYLTGEYYDSSRERFLPEEEIYDFALSLFPDVADAEEPLEVDVFNDDVIHEFSTIYDIEENLYVIGELRNADGKVMNKETDPLSEGCTLAVTIGDYTMSLALPVVERYSGASTLHELTPYNNALAEGETLSLVIPIVWQDQPENGTEEALKNIYSKLGRVMAQDGTITDYSENLTEQFSLSEYFDTASYGTYTITSFVSDWYQAPYEFQEMQYQGVGTDTEFRDEVYRWLMERYPDMDWSRFDADGDGIFDSVIFINTGKRDGDTVVMAGYGYALFVSFGYTGEGAGTKDTPVFKNFVSINTEFLEDNALIHEVSHSFGIIDYYDVGYSGIDAVGKYDMQSDGFGDWNAYSKYAVGWIEPEVVSGLEKGESIEISIGAFSETGDAIVIPAAEAEHDGPFGEYIILELFTDGGVNRYDSVKYGLDGAVGVRISHVNAAMEKRVLIGEDGTEYPIGTTHLVNSYNKKGQYQIEVIQAGGTNTFTSSERENGALVKEDLFAAGDSFDVADYKEFFVNGRMDDGKEFGYTVKIVSIEQVNGEYTAVVRITRK